MNFMEDRTAPISVLIVVASLCPAFGSCVTGHVVEEFNRVNKGLESNVRPHDSAMVEERVRLEASECVEALLVSDTLRASYKAISMRIDTLKLRMVASSPTNYLAADSAYELNGTGDRLHQEMKTFFEQAMRVVRGDTAEAEVTALRRFLEEPPPPENWRIRHLHHVPSVAVITVLSKFQSNVAHAESLCMSKLQRDCSER